MKNNQNFLGLHCSFTTLSHDPSASLFTDSAVRFAIEEERINRIKTSVGYVPIGAITKILASSQLNINDIDLIIADGETYPFLDQKIERMIRDYFGYSPPVELANHARCHTASAYFGSGFNHSLCISVDGIGDGISTLVEAWSPNKVVQLYAGGEDASLGLFYSLFTNYLGFRSIEGEYKVMGMAAYGKPRFDLSSVLSFDDATGVIYFNKKFQSKNYYSSIWEPSYVESEIYNLVGVPRRPGGDKSFSQCHFDLAASVQATFAKAYLSLVSHYARKVGTDHIALSGGCALNCLANKELRKAFPKLYVFPAASDRGLSIGAALEAARKRGIEVLPVDSMYLGALYESNEIENALSESGLRFEKVIDPAIVAASCVASGQVVGWFQDRSEFGPRALGSRSILAAANLAGTKDLLNKKIKFREEFRPFAPAVLEEETASLLETHYSSPYMTFTVDITNPETIAEAVHIDGTARIQTVPESGRGYHPMFRRLLLSLKDITGTGAVINTSFNLAGEPIVESPRDAIRTYVSSGIDVLVIGDFVTRKSLLSA